MGSYLISIVVMTAFVGLISYISYPGVSEKAIRVVSAVLLIYTVALPIVSFSGRLSDGDFLGGISDSFPGDAELGEETYIEVAKAAFADGICEMIYSKYGIKKENIKVYVFDLDFERMVAGKIKIVLTGKSALSDWRGIEQYINGSGLGKCEVTADFEQ